MGFHVYAIYLSYHWIGRTLSAASVHILATGIRDRQEMSGDLLQCIVAGDFRVFCLLVCFASGQVRLNPQFGATHPEDMLFRKWTRT